MTRLRSFLKGKSQYLCRKLLYLVTGSSSWFVKHCCSNVLGDALTTVNQMCRNYLCIRVPLAAPTFLPHLLSRSCVRLLPPEELSWSGAQGCSCILPRFSFWFGNGEGWVTQKHVAPCCCGLSVVQMRGTSTEIAMMWRASSLQCHRQVWFVVVSLEIQSSYFIFSLVMQFEFRCVPFA